MKRLIQLVAAMLLFNAIVATARSQDIPWAKSLDEGLSKARETSKLVLLEFHNPG